GGGPGGRRPAPRRPGPRRRRSRRLPGLRAGRGAGSADPGPRAGAAASRDRVSFLVGAAYRDLRRTGLAGATAVLLTALAALVAGATVAGRQALTGLTAGWRAELRIVALLREDAGGAGGKPGIVSDVQALPGVAAVRYVSSREALAELRRYLGALGQDGDGLDHLPVNPVPARLVVTPVPATSAARLAALADPLVRGPPVQAGALGAGAGVGAGRGGGARPPAGRRGARRPARPGRPRSGRRPHQPRPPAAGRRDRDPAPGRGVGGPAPLAAPPAGRRARHGRGRARLERPGPRLRGRRAVDRRLAARHAGAADPAPAGRGTPRGAAGCRGRGRAGGLFAGRP